MEKVFARVRFSSPLSVAVARTSQSPFPLPAMLGRPHRTTRFDRLTTDICRTNGESWKPNRVSTNEKPKILWQTFIANGVEVNIPAFQVWLQVLAQKILTAKNTNFMKEVKNLNTLVKVAVANIQVYQVWLQVLAQKVRQRNINQQCKNYFIKGGFATFDIFNQKFIEWKHLQL